MAVLAPPRPVVEAPEPIVEAPPATPGEPTVPKLSEAMRKGSLMTAPAFGRLYVYQETAAKRACALGAAIIGAYGSTNIYGSWTGWEDYWPDLPLTRKTCPDCLSHDEYMLHHLITHLNDNHEWTRERVADYLESQGF